MSQNVHRRKADVVKNDVQAKNKVSPTAIERRYPQSDRKPPKWFMIDLLVCTSYPDEPTVCEALRKNGNEHWQTSIETELQALEKIIFLQVIPKPGK